MKGYLNQPEATAQALKDGWLHTGDLACMDQDGYIYIVDHKKALIIRGGYNVYTRKIEEIFYQHPAVLGVVVVGVLHHDLDGVASMGDHLHDCRCVPVAAGRTRSPGQ